ncbi:hypothetical protein [Nocardioides montaniterrae]
MTRTARLSSLAVLALSATLVTGCGGGGSDASPFGSHSNTTTDSGGTVTTTGTPLTQAQAEQAALGPADVPADWKMTTSTADSSESDAPGCLAEIGKLTDAIDGHRVAKASHDFEPSSGLPQVTSEVSSYQDAGELATVFSNVKDKLASCTQVTGTVADGTSFDMTLDSDLTTVPDGADDAIGYHAEGTVSASGQTIHMYIDSQMTLLHGTVVTVSTIDTSNDPSLITTYADKAWTKAQGVIGE